jgi:hypothetical protein
MLFSSDASIYTGAEEEDEGGRNSGWCDSTTLAVKLLLAVLIVHFLAG